MGWCTRKSAMPHEQPQGAMAPLHQPTALRLCLCSPCGALCRQAAACLNVTLQLCPRAAVVVQLLQTASQRQSRSCSPMHWRDWRGTLRRRRCSSCGAAPSRGRPGRRASSRSAGLTWAGSATTPRPTFAAGATSPCRCCSTSRRCATRQPTSPTVQPDICFEELLRCSAVSAVHRPLLQRVWQPHEGVLQSGAG